MYIADFKFDLIWFNLIWFHVLFEQWSLNGRLGIDDDGYIIMSYLRHGNSDK